MGLLTKLMGKASKTDANEQITQRKDLENRLSGDRRKQLESSGLDNNSSDDDGWLFKSFETIGMRDRDVLFEEVGRYVIKRNRASLGDIQRSFRIGFARATRILDQLCNCGVVGNEKETKFREILISMDQFEELVHYLNDSVFNSVQEDLNREYDIYDRRFASDTNNQALSYLDSLPNILLANCDGGLRDQIIEGLFDSYSNRALRTIIIDLTGFDFHEYGADQHLLAPIITEIQIANKALQWTISEIQERQKKFVKLRVKTISAHNDKSDEIFPRIVVIINECEPLFADPQFSELVTIILLQGLKVGVHLIFFSAFSDKNIELGKNRDLLKIVSKTTTSFFNIDSIFPFAKSTGDEVTLGSSDIIDQVDKMTGIDFECFCKTLLLQNGYYDIRTTKSSSDYGADITAIKDDIHYAIQCKRYSGMVGEDAVREVYASKQVYGAEIAVVLTNSTFTNAAKQLASHNSVHLWDRKILEKMISMAVDEGSH